MYVIFENLLDYCELNYPKDGAFKVGITYGQVAFEFRNFKQAGRAFKRLKDHCRNSNQIGP